MMQMFRDPGGKPPPASPLIPIPSSPRFSHDRRQYPGAPPFEPRAADIAGRRIVAIGRTWSVSSADRRSSVFVRLLFLSLIVGFFLVWLDIRPVDVLIGLRNMVEHFWATGFDAIRDIAEYVAAGAAIVVPVWLVLRLLNMRGRTEHDTARAHPVCDAPAGPGRHLLFGHIGLLPVGQNLATPSF